MNCLLIVVVIFIFIKHHKTNSPSGATLGERSTLGFHELLDRDIHGSRILPTSGDFREGSDAHFIGTSSNTLKRRRGTCRCKLVSRVCPIGRIVQLDPVVGDLGVALPAHLAAALGTFTVSIFDPRRSSLPIRWQPLGLGVLLRPDVPTCEKCIGEACAYWDCLDRIKVSDVAAQISELVKNPQQLTNLQIINI